MKLCFYISSASKLETWMAKDDATGCPDKFGTGDFKHYSNNAKKAQVNFGEFTRKQKNHLTQLLCLTFISSVSYPKLD